MQRACNEQIRAHTGLVDVGFVDVNLVAGYICGNMNNAQGEGGLYLDHLVYCRVAQVCSHCE